MSIYSIKDLEHLSGIKAHTIRIWEQRHNLFSPERTHTNIRFYSESDLKLILNIALLKNHGIKISKIVNMTSEQIREEVLRLGTEEQTNADQLNAMTVAMLDMDEKAFNSVIVANSEKIGFEKTMIDIIYPFFKKIGILWMSGSINPAHEHFISNLVRQRLIMETSSLKIADHSKSFILFLPEGELHEISLLFANYLIRAKGFFTLYLGQSVPTKDLEEVYHSLAPDYIFTVLTSKPTSDKVQSFIDDLSRRFRQSKVYVTGAQVVGQDVTLPENIEVISRLEDLAILLSGIQSSIISG